LAAMHGQSLSPPGAAVALAAALPGAPFALPSDSFEFYSAVTIQSPRGPPAPSL
jgi:hypothetical protein